jgi:hypothetical protein
MLISGTAELWFLIPQVKGKRRNVLLEQCVEDGFLFGKTVTTNRDGDLCLEILGDLAWACEVATYLEFMAELVAADVN